MAGVNGRLLLVACKIAASYPQESLQQKEAFWLFAYSLPKRRMNEGWLLEPASGSRFTCFTSKAACVTPDIAVSVR
jgi:hypothetical protein